MRFRRAGENVAERRYRSHRQAGGPRTTGTYLSQSAAILRYLRRPPEASGRLSRHAGDVWFGLWDFEPGDRVEVRGFGLRGHRGTLIRRTRLPWNLRRAWVVELDAANAPGGKRQRIGEAILVPEQ